MNRIKTIAAAILVVLPLISSGCQALQSVSIFPGSSGLPAQSEE
ncbi:hypothetical protein KOR42_20370 [Thalassoglobus neptunius]|uniref:Uncharacterized protein n=1 Tax=Thalassoglobus neptunius TaxID=1938619 RepID=A0A5C5X931_9PLAN|nr:hypothetical protein [Thalassoglobus neptunius]TWT58655.1 hypothetical protein KOR42_20370 [Thalassoglobus neptunius]